MLVFSICCNTGTGTAGKTAFGDALNSHFEASGYGMGKEASSPGPAQLSVACSTELPGLGFISVGLGLIWGVVRATAHMRV